MTTTARWWLLRFNKMMKKIVVSLLSFLVGSGIASALSGFTPMAGTSGAGSFSMECAVSGFSVGADGTVVGHGAAVAPVAQGAGVDVAVAANPQTVSVYTVDGILIFRSDCGEFEAESLPAGLYIICRGNSVEKFLKSL